MVPSGPIVSKWAADVFANREFLVISAIPAQMDQLLQRKAVKDVRKIHANLYLGYFFWQFGFVSVFFPAGGSVERCGNETCQFGARCKHNQVEGSLKCSCDFYCDQESKKPVCGSDGNTYRSECELQWRSCHLQTHILITEYAPCQCKLHSEAQWRKDGCSKFCHQWIPNFFQFCSLSFTLSLFLVWKVGSCICYFFSKLGIH